MYIDASGCGGFLNPPTHPEHTHCVMEGPRRDPRAIMSLSSAAAEGFAPAQALLDAWQPGEIDRDWVAQVLGYFRHCFQSPSGSWNASDLAIDNQRDPMDAPETHAGVNLIRKYYPAYVPTYADFGGAYWGKKP